MSHSSLLKMAWCKSYKKCELHVNFFPANYLELSLVVSIFALDSWVTGMSLVT